MTGSRTNATLNFEAHDYHHAWIDMTNPCLRAWEELCDLVPKDMYEIYLDREIGAYRHAISLQGPNASLGGVFWEGLVRQLSKGRFKTISDQELLKSVYRPIVDHIWKNQERWKEEYGITLESFSSLKGYIEHSSSYKAFEALIAEY